MKVIIDTNVVISAALKNENPESLILFISQHPDFEWIISKEILEEYKGVFRRKKFGFSREILFTKVSQQNLVQQKEINILKILAF